MADTDTVTMLRRRIGPSCDTKITQTTVRVFEYKLTTESLRKFGGDGVSLPADFSHVYFGCWEGQPPQLNRLLCQTQIRQSYPLLTTKEAMSDIVK